MEENKQSFGEIDKVKSHAYGSDRTKSNNISNYRRGLEATELQERRKPIDKHQREKETT